MSNHPTFTEVELHKMSKHDLICILLEHHAPPPPHTTLAIPTDIFIPALGPLESICRYLKDTKHLTFHTIAHLLNRNDRTIWTSYHNAQRKHPAPLRSTTRPLIPVAILADRILSILEHLTSYLKDTKHLTFHTIAELLHRDDRTIWTAYHRAQHKRL